MRFLALGDSYTIGEGVAESDRWPVQLVRLLNERNIDVDDPVIIARTGWTTDELDRAIDQAEPKGGFDLVSLLIGVNNQYRGRSEKEYRAEFSGLLQRAIGFVDGNRQRVIVLSIPDWGVTPFANGKERAKISAEIDSFNSIKHEETVKAGAQFIDVTPISRKALNDPSMLASDGLHPSPKMYAEWVRLVLPIAASILSEQHQPD